MEEVQNRLFNELEDGIPIIVVGNKNDLVNKVVCQAPDDGISSVLGRVQELSHSNHFLQPIECSAKTGENVPRIFSAVAHELVQRSMKPAYRTARKTQLTPSSRSRCC